ncbi:ribonuclease-like [Thamnophis elegans]|uniref:ribonuclease-like n=1 Tax=Thamnophis elegans TaxID=35005 RepID=UPI001376805A|nr:ribonuclease-like [Thamnophis elegans]
MWFKGFGLGLFVVLAAVLILGTFAATYQEFLEHHYDYPRSNVRGNYCNGMMRRRGMTSPKCKPLNTFIHDTRNRIIAVCGNEGTLIPRVHPTDPDLWRSHREFRVTTCKLRGSSLDPPCEYRGNTSPRYIVVGCGAELPTHYQEANNCPALRKSEIEYYAMLALHHYSGNNIELGTVFGKY